MPIGIYPITELEEIFSSGKNDIFISLTINEKNKLNINIKKHNVTHGKGYILGVDLSYPKELHVLNSDFPLAPENKFDNKQLPKLLTTLYDKKKYIIHYETLKTYIK